MAAGPDFGVKVADEFGITLEEAQLVIRMLCNDHFRQSVLACWDIYDKKGKDYTIGKGDADRLDNFNMAAENCGVSVRQAWGVYFYKQVAAVFKFVKDGRVESEPIESRLYDVINYCILLLKKIKDGEGGS
jgi:hypothetical protein